MVEDRAKRMRHTRHGRRGGSLIGWERRGGERSGYGHAQRELFEEKCAITIVREKRGKFVEREGRGVRDTHLDDSDTWRNCGVRGRR